MPVKTQNADVEPPAAVPDPVPIPPPPSPPPAKSLWANIMGGAGIVVMLLAGGYQWASKNDPEIIAKMGDAIDWAQLAGFILAAGGLTKHTMEKKDNEKQAAAAIDTQYAAAVTAVDATHAAVSAAVTAAELAPPIDPATNKPGVYVSIAAATEQAMLAKNTKLAAALVKAVEENPAP